MTKLTKTAQQMIQEAKNGYVSVEYGFEYGREFGKRNINAANELVKDGKLELVRQHPFSESNKGFTKMHGTQFVFRVVA